MDLRGRDPVTECYRVVIDVDGAPVMGMVPERLAPAINPVHGRPSHQDAYVWLAANKTKIEAAIATLARGSGRPKAPYDQITLSEDF